MRCLVSGANEACVVLPGLWWRVGRKQREIAFEEPYVTDANVVRVLSREILPSLRNDRRVFRCAWGPEDSNEQVLRTERRIRWEHEMLTVGRGVPRGRYDL